MGYGFKKIKIVPYLNQNLKAIDIGELNMKNIDNRNKLEEQPFTFNITKKKTIRIFILVSQ